MYSPHYVARPEDAGGLRPTSQRIPLSRAQQYAAVRGIYEDSMVLAMHRHMPVPITSEQSRIWNFNHERSEYAKGLTPRLPALPPVNGSYNADGSMNYKPPRLVVFPTDLTPGPH